MFVCSIYVGDDKYKRTTIGEECLTTEKVYTILT